MTDSSLQQILARWSEARVIANVYVSSSGLDDAPKCDTTSEGKSKRCSHSMRLRETWRLPSGKYCARSMSPSRSIRHVATCLPDAITLVAVLLPLPYEQMTPQLLAVPPTPSLPLVLMLRAARPNDVLLELLGARSRTTEKERDE
jgi:hypothetical protein